MNAANLAGVQPGFYSNAAIRRIAPAPRWTVSDSEKKPLNLRALMAGDDRLGGAISPTISYLGTLEELVTTIPAATNHAFFLDSLEDELMVLDIEPSCPIGLLEDLLRLPALYRETSMSGLGHHLILPLPPSAHTRPQALAQRKLRDRFGWFEVLQRHYITFTGKLTQAAEPLLPLDAWDALYASLADQRDYGSQQSGDPSLLAIPAGLPEHPRNEELLEQLTRQLTRSSLRPLADFNGDHSGFEFSALGRLLVRLRRWEAILDCRLDPGHEAWLIYLAATQLLPSRRKHNELRGDRPLLLDRAAYIVSLNAPPAQGSTDATAAVTVTTA